MTDDALFPPTPAERLARIALFVSARRREYVTRRDVYYGHIREVCTGLIAECERMLEHVAALAEAET